MKHLLTAVLLLAGTSFVAPFAAKSAHAEPLPELVARAKPSVLLVGSYAEIDSPRFGFRGTGFVVGDGNLAVTNAHVLPNTLPGEGPNGSTRRVAVQVFDADGHWTTRQARLLAADTSRDLALLRFEGPALPALKLAQPGALREGEDVALIGFPIGGALGFSHVTHRGILAARTAISQPAVSALGLNPRAAAQLRQGAYDILQLDITAYPGNSGGPVFELGQGAVAGVLSMGLVKGTRESALSAPSGISYAVPVEHVISLIERGAGK